MPPAKKGCAASHLIARVALEEKRQIYEIGARISAKEMQFQVQYRTMQQTKNQISFDHVCLSCCQPLERERGKERRRQTHHFYRCPQNKTRDRDRRLTKRIKRFGEIHLFSLFPHSDINGARFKGGWCDVGFTWYSSEWGFRNVERECLEGEKALACLFRDKPHFPRWTFLL